MPVDVDLGHAHRVGDGAEAPNRLDRAAKIVGLDRARLREPLAEPAERLLVEARHRRAAELIVDHQPDGIRADVDDGVRRPFHPVRPLGIEVERAFRFAFRAAVVFGIALSSVLRDHGRDQRVWLDDVGPTLPAPSKWTKEKRYSWPRIQPSDSNFSTDNGSRRSSIHDFYHAQKTHGGVERIFPALERSKPHFDCVARSVAELYAVFGTARGQRRACRTPVVLPVCWRR